MKENVGKDKASAHTTAASTLKMWVPLAAALWRKWLQLELPAKTKNTGERRRTPVAHNRKFKR
jgi:hypothetical protein